MATVTSCDGSAQASAARAQAPVLPARGVTARRRLFLRFSIRLMPFQLDSHPRRGTKKAVCSVEHLGDVLGRAAHCQDVEGGDEARNVAADPGVERIVDAARATARRSYGARR